LSLTDASGDEAVLEGRTRDMRATGLSLVVPEIRVGGRSIVSEDRTLRVVLELPTGPVEMQVVPVRCEPLDEKEPGQGYLIGSRIKEISDADCVSFIKYLRTLR
jgi:hypothetical protein